MDPDILGILGSDLALSSALVVYPLAAAAPSQVAAEMLLVAVALPPLAVETLRVVAVSLYVL